MFILHLHVAWWHVQLGQLQSISPSDTLACSWWSTKELWYGLKYKIFLFIKKTVWGRLREGSMVTREEEWGEGIVREFGIEMCRLLYLKWITSRDPLWSTGRSARCYEAAFRPSLGKKGYVCMYSWVPSLFTWNYHNIVNQLYPNKLKSFKKKKLVF